MIERKDLRLKFEIHTFVSPQEAAKEIDYEVDLFRNSLTLDELGSDLVSRERKAVTRDIQTLLTPRREGDRVIHTSSGGEIIIRQVPIASEEEQQD